MIKLNLQFFGGRGGAGGKRSESNTTYREIVSKTKSGAAVVKVGDAMRAIKASAEKVAPSGDYVGRDGSEYSIDYKRTRDEGGNPTIAQTVDGHEYGGYVTRLSEKEYLGSNDVGEEIYTRSYDKAAKHAFKLPRDWKKKK